MNIIYFLQHENGTIKIGTTTMYRKRLVKLETQHGPLKLLGVMEGARALEHELHLRFAHLRIKGTLRDGNSQGKEFFRPHESLLEFIRTNSQDIQLEKVDAGMNVHADGDSNLKRKWAMAATVKGMTLGRFISQAVNEYWEDELAKAGIYVANGGTNLFQKENKSNGNKHE